MPEPWQVETKHCRSCKGETHHRRNVLYVGWMCVDCGRKWVSEEQLASDKALARKLLSSDIWGKDE